MGTFNYDFDAVVRRRRQAKVCGTLMSDFGFIFAFLEYSVFLLEKVMPMVWKKLCAL